MNDISSVPAEFIKYFIILATFLAGNYLMLRKAGGRREDPVHIKTPIETKRQPTYAEKKDVDEKLGAVNARLEKIEERFRQDCRQLTEDGNRRMEKITIEIHKMKDELGEKLDKSLQQTYQRINGQDRRIALLEGRLQITPPAQD